MTLAPPMGILGGTFNPVHRGHLQPAAQAAKLAGIEKVALMPCFLPPHKDAPQVSAQQRLEMVRLAARDNPLFSVDDREILQPGPSYSVTTLTALRQQYPNTPLCFFMGMDSLLNFDSWVRYEEILTLSHLVVCNRPGYQPSFNSTMRELLHHHLVTDRESLHTFLAGSIMICETEQVACSSTQLRDAIARGEDVSAQVNQAVYDYILANGLYQSPSGLPL